MADVRLELPFPPSGLNPNRKSHYMVKAKIVREYREVCAWTAVACEDENRRQRALGTREGAYRKPLTPPVSAVVTFVVPDRRKRDLDNLLAMLKPAWDGLVDAGVLSGDDSEVFSVESADIAVTEEATHKGKSCVIVVLRSL